MIYLFFEDVTFLNQFVQAICKDELLPGSSVVPDLEQLPGDKAETISTCCAVNAWSSSYMRVCVCVRARVRVCTYV